jgi:hypothetical protein
VRAALERGHEEDALNAKRMLSHILSSLGLLLGLSLAPAEAADAEIGAEAAKTLPIIDSHFHVVQGLNGAALMEVMDRNGVRMTGGVGGYNMQEAIMALGPRFIRPAGMGVWLNLHRNLDDAAFANADTPAVKQALTGIEAELRDRGARVIGEIHVNSLTTAAEPTHRFKTPADTGTLKAIFALAGKYGRPLNIHAQWDHPDTVQQVGNLAASSPGSRLMISHCGSNSSAADMRRMFEKHPNVVCDLSARGWPLQKNRFTVYEDSTLARDWRTLIEQFPDRFAVGVDLAQNAGEYEASLRAIRFGLLANLSPETAEKVAYKNAEIWFGLR